MKAIRSSEKMESPAGRSWGVLVAAMATGTLLWWFLVAATGKHEGWDSPAYLPLLLLASCLFGAAAPRHPWRWAAGLLMGQAIFLFVPRVADLWPAGLLFTLAMFLPSVLAAWAGALLRQRLAHPSDAAGGGIGSSQLT
jgi:hypothetical protein